MMFRFGGDVGLMSSRILTEDGMACDGHLLSMGFDLQCLIGSVNEISEFVRIFAKVIEFFASIVVMDVAVVLRCDGVIAGSKTGPGEIGPICLRIFQKGNQGMTFVEFVG